MKRISFIVTALLLLTALTQCKKDVQVSPAIEGNTVDITLNIKGGGGSRVDVNTATGAVNYESGDKIYVVSGGKYVGTLTHNGTCFGGTITDPTVGEPLYFYFLGNVTPAEPLVTGVTTTCSVNISDQTERLPVIECAPSNENYVSGLTTFTAMLLNKCALVKFNVTTSSEAATCIKGMKNKVMVNFLSNGMTPIKEGDGAITLPAGSGERWAILLPQGAVAAGTVGSAYSEDGFYTGTHGAVPAISENEYLTAGIDVMVNIEINSGEVPTGAICGKFTINGNGDQVYFSQGNLQYNKTTSEWSFMEHQYDIVETDGQDVGSDYANQNIVSLFGWGTSGWNNGNTYYQPYSTSKGEISEGYGYGPTDGTNYSYSLTGIYANADWGVYNAITNGGNEPGYWRTLTMDEWEYIFDIRTTNSGKRLAFGIVNGSSGMLLLPDNWDESCYALEYDWSYNSNWINATQWNELEQYGVVFLPAAGTRFENMVYNSEFYDNNGSGRYWSSNSHDDGCFEAFCIGFYADNLCANYDSEHRCNGISVRLVCPVP